MKRDITKTQVHFWKPGEEVFADNVGVARLLFLLVCTDLRVPDSALRLAVDQFSELPSDIDEPLVFDPPLELPTWNFRYQSEADFRTACHEALERHLDWNLGIWRKVLAEEGFKEVKPHQQPRTLVKDLRLLAEYWLNRRRPKDLVREMETAGHQAPADSAFWKALERARKALGLPKLPRPDRRTS